jgi:phospholipase/carboxylesterase
MFLFYQGSAALEGANVDSCWQDERVNDAIRIDAAATQWSHPEQERSDKPLLVLLHGYGADEHDLFGLVPYLPAELVVASVAAPLTPPWPMPGRSWYDIDDLTTRDPAVITVAAQALHSWLDETVPDATKVALLGFSQGAAVSLQAMRLSPTRFSAVVALSGYAPQGSLPGDIELRELRPPVFWGRGSLDEVIPMHHIDHTAQWLPDHSELSGRVYPGLGHGISEPELDDIRVFLEKWLSEKQ